MSMISELVEKLRRYAAMYDLPPYSMVSEETRRLLMLSADTIEELSTKLRAANANSRWIPIEERMPEEHDSIFTEVLGTDKLGFLNESLSDNVLVTIKFNSGVTKTDVMSTHDGKWYFSFGDRVNETLSKVIAWRPLPEPYMEVQDETN